MSPTPPARLSERPLHARKASSVSLDSSSENEKIDPQDHFSFSSISQQASLRQPSPCNINVFERQEYVRWGIVWHAPALMLLYGIGGLAIAIGHHIYFASLHGTQAASSVRQQWPTAIGTASSFLVVTLLRAANCAAYTQYIWSLVRRRSYKLSTLDKMFALTTEPIGLLGWEIIKHAKIALFVALFCWITPLAGILPPATLSIVPGEVIFTQATSMGQVDWNLGSFYDVQSDFSLPSSEVQGVAIQAAIGMEVVSIKPPEPNSTFSMQFYGPAVKCTPLNSTHQIVLDYYNNVTRTSRQFVTRNSLDLELKNNTVFNDNSAKTIRSFNPLVFSAFAPYGGIQGWFFGIDSKDPVDQFNNWDVDLPWEMEYLGYKVSETLPDDIVQQLYVQTATDGFHCTMGNASYNADFEFINGLQTSVKYSTTDFLPMMVKRSGGGAGGGAMREEIVRGPYNGTYHTTLELSYMAIWTSFASLISGNISLGYREIDRSSDNKRDTNLTLVQTNSRILLNGLSACTEITNNYWSDLPLQAEDPKESPVEFFNPDGGRPHNSSNNLFDKPSWMCRNTTLIRAIEDLAGNITISMMSSTRLTTLNATLVDVTSRQTRNVYRYSSQNLIMSYSIATFLCIICTVLGIFSLLDNGVAHSTSFSALLATSRNAHLDDLNKGHSLGSLPLDEGLASVKLRFGVISTSRRSGVQDRRLGFGFDHQVQEIEKFGKYI